MIDFPNTNIPQAMKLSDYDLRQIDEERINKLPETAVKNLLITLPNDLKEARERLNQNSKNSSIPPGSEAPLDKASRYSDEENDDESLDDIEALDKAIHPDTRSLPNDCHLCHHGFNAEHTCAELGRSNSVAYIAFDAFTLEWGFIKSTRNNGC